MNTGTVTGKSDAYILKTYGRRGLAFEEGEGVTLRDVDGVEYLDFNSGLGVNALGHCHPEVVRLIHRQAERVIHTSNLYHIPPQARVAEKLCNASFGERVFFCNSGTEAVEGALKFARKWGTRQDLEKTEVIAFGNSFHGRTFGALSATMQDHYRAGFEPLLSGFHKAVFNDLDSVKEVMTERTAAVIIEPLQGEGGVRFADPSFMTGLADLCRDNGVLLVVDEVQCGMGRTGRLFCHEHFGITPDIMTLAKPLAGGLPIGAIVVGPRVWPHINPGEHASTFGGNHFVTGVAEGVFDILADEAFLADVRAKGDHLASRLRSLAGTYDVIKEVRGKGLLMGIVVDFPAAEAVDWFEKRHVLICSAGKQVIRFIPPLVVSMADIDRVCDLLDEFLAGKAS